MSKSTGTASRRMPMSTERKVFLGILGVGFGVITTCQTYDLVTNGSPEKIKQRIYVHEGRIGGEYVVFRQTKGVFLWDNILAVKRPDGSVVKYVADGRMNLRYMLINDGKQVTRYDVSLEPNNQHSQTAQCQFNTELEKIVTAKRHTNLETTQ